MDTTIILVSEHKYHRATVLKTFVFVLVFEYILKVKVLVVQWTLHFVLGIHMECNSVDSSELVFDLDDFHIHKNGSHGS